MKSVFALLVGALLASVVFAGPAITTAKAQSFAAMTTSSSVPDETLLARCKQIFDGKKYRGTVDWFEGQNTIFEYAFRVNGLINAPDGRVVCSINFTTHPVGPSPEFKICGRTTTSRDGAAVTWFNGGQANGHWSQAPGSIISFIPGSDSKVLVMFVRFTLKCGDYIERSTLLDLVD